MLSNYICALDIGSSKISFFVVSIKKKQINSAFFESIPSLGVRKGVVVDAIALTESLNKLFRRARQVCNFPLRSVMVNISGQDVITRHSRAVIPLTERGNKVITLSDVHRADEQARILASSLDEEIIHQVPFGYTIDSRENIQNPLGLYSHRLETDLYLISSRLASLQSLIRAVNQAGCEIKRMYFSGLATSSLALHSHEFKVGTYVLCDSGKDVTELLFFNNGVLFDVEILPIGGDDFTLSLQHGLGIPYEAAEKIKLSSGIIQDAPYAFADKEILIQDHKLYKPVKQSAVVQRLSAKAENFSIQIKEAIARKIRSGRADSFICCGRNMLLEGLLEKLESALGIPVKSARIMEEYESAVTPNDELRKLFIHDVLSLMSKNSSFSGQKYFTYLTALGMIYDTFLEKKGLRRPCGKSSAGLIQNFLARIKEFYQEYF